MNVPFISILLLAAAQTEATGCSVQIPGLDLNGLNYCPESECSPECNTGYVAVQSALYTCTADGQWIENVPLECVPAIDCIAQGPLITEDGYLEYCTGTAFGDTCLTHCYDGYSGGSRCYTCNKFGDWEPCVQGASDLECTPLECPETLPNIPTGGVGVCPGATHYECTGTCRDGYIGPDVLFKCSDKNTWDSEGVDFNCNPVNCGNLMIDNIEMDCPSTNYEGEDCDVQLSCDNGNQLVSYRCDTDGLWKQITEATNCVLPPTTLPTISPLFVPSFMPSFRPSFAPSIIPSDGPTVVPIIMSTKAPNNDDKNPLENQENPLEQIIDLICGKDGCETGDGNVSSSERGSFTIFITILVIAIICGPFVCLCFAACCINAY